MKRKILCAFLLMGIALSVTIGILAAPEAEKEIYVWQSVRFAAEHTVLLYDAHGNLIQTIEPSDGIAVSKLLPQGRYYAFTDKLCAEFLLRTDRSVTIEGGCGWCDGEVLHITNEAVGTFCVEFLADDTFYDFRLTGTDEEWNKTVRGICNQTGRCEFYGLPYGSYVLYLGEEKVANVELSAEQPQVILVLSKIT